MKHVVPTLLFTGIKYKKNIFKFGFSIFLFLLLKYIIFKGHCQQKMFLTKYNTMDLTKYTPPPSNHTTSPWVLFCVNSYFLFHVQMYEFFNTFETETLALITVCARSSGPYRRGHYFLDTRYA